jgi:hypothetical protein
MFIPTRWDFKRRLVHQHKLFPQSGDKSQPPPTLRRFPRSSYLLRVANDSLYRPNRVAQPRASPPSSPTESTGIHRGTTGFTRPRTFGMASSSSHRCKSLDLGLKDLVRVLAAATAPAPTSVPPSPPALAAFLAPAPAPAPAPADEEDDPCIPDPPRYAFQLNGS